MALLFMDTFDHYRYTDILKKWTAENATGQSFTSTSTAALAFPGGGQTLTVTSGGNNVFLSKTLASTYATGVIGGWFYFGSALPGSTDHIMSLVDTGSIQVNVSGDGAGHLTIQRGGGPGSAGTVLATSASTVSTGTWYHIEMKATISDASGVIQLKVNGTDYIASTSGLDTKNTANAYFNQIWTPNYATPANKIETKLLYVLDTSGSSANDFLGVCRGAVLRPVAAGNYAQWTANSGANFWCAADHFVFHDGDLSYNATTTTNNIDSFVCEDLPAGSGTVHAVQTVIVARQDAGAARTMAPHFRISSTDYAGTTVSLAATYSFFLQAYSVSPATSSAWTVSELNGAEFGYKLIS